MKINPGQLRHRISVQSVTVIRGSDGGFTESWATAATRWARVEPITGAEFERAETVISEHQFKITMRFYDGLTTKHRISWGSRVLNIISVEVIDEIEHWTVVRATEANK